MSAIRVRNVPPQIVSALKRRAASNRRSMQQEILCILEKAAKEAPTSDVIEPIQLITTRTGREGTWSREETYDDDGR